MKLINDSLTIVILGDWNKLYIQPDWIANNIFEKTEMEIGIEGQGSDVNISYQYENIIIHASQEKVVFSVTNNDSSTLSELSRVVQNYIDKAYTPSIIAYGMNVDYTESEDTKLAEMFDNLSDTDAIINLKYEIVESKIERTIKKDGKVINITCLLDGQLTKFHFNEHYGSPDKSSIDLSNDAILEFINRTKELVENFGYEYIEDEE